jgi:hypothetical protein
LTAKAAGHQRQDNGNHIAEVMRRIRKESQTAREKSSDEFSQRYGRIKDGGCPKPPIHSPLRDGVVMPLICH